VLALLSGSLYLLFAYSARRGLEALSRSIFAGLAATTVRGETLDSVSPILIDRDTVGRLISLAHVENHASSLDSFLVYVGTWSGGRARGMPLGSLAAVDSGERSSLQHELRLVPRTSVGTRRRLGILRLIPDSIAIPVYRAESSNH
jgi:hypothetical protein